MRVKCFCDYPERIESAINEWLDQNKAIEDIKYVFHSSYLPDRNPNTPSGGYNPVPIIAITIFYK